MSKRKIIIQIVVATGFISHGLFASAQILNPFHPRLPKQPKEIIRSALDPLLPSQPYHGANPELPQTNSQTSEPRATAVPKFVINGIIWNTDHPQAIINGHVLSVGDMIEEATIINIHKSQIEMKLNGKPLNITP